MISYCCENVCHLHSCHTTSNSRYELNIEYHWVIIKLLSMYDAIKCTCCWNKNNLQIIANSILHAHTAGNMKSKWINQSNSLDSCLLHAHKQQTTLCRRRHPTHSPSNPSQTLFRIPHHRSYRTQQRLLWSNHPPIISFLAAAGYPTSHCSHQFQKYHWARVTSN